MQTAMNFNIASDNAGLNRALFHVTHGLYILTTVAGERMNGQCLDALMQVTNAPPRIAIAVGKRTLTHDMISEALIFTANAIDREDPSWMEKVKHFGFQSGRTVDKFADYTYIVGDNGAPILPDANAFYECRVIQEMTLDLKTHHLFVAEVLRAGISEKGAPLTYNEYRKIKSSRGGKNG